MGAKVKKIDKVGDGPDYTFYCPGCKEEHGVWTTRSRYNNCTWTFNGNLEKPTFLPSVMVRHGLDIVCHLYITEGVIHFLGDCTHELVNQSVPMEDIR
jgi:hypothetical protein